MINASRLDELPEQGKEALVGDPLADSLQKKAMVNGVEGNHDRLPHSKTFLNRSSSHEQVIHSKACAYRSSADGNALADHISCCFFQTSRAD